MTDGERIAALEVEMREVRADTIEIKNSVKALEVIAARGSGMFQTVLVIGGLIGWLVGLAAAILSLFRH